jgi:hypothetical protein
MIYTLDRKTLRPRSILGRIVLTTVIISALSSAAFFSMGFRQGRNILQNLSPEEKIVILNDYDKFTPQKLKDYLKSLNIPHPDIVYAQAVLETGNFTSSICVKNNNLFGMKVATVRPSTNIGEEDGHAAFKHWRHSVLDYALYSACYIPFLSKNEYLQYLGKRYAEDPNYVSKLKTIIDKNPI